MLVAKRNAEGVARLPGPGGVTGVRAYAEAQPRQRRAHGSGERFQQERAKKGPPDLSPVVRRPPKGSSQL